MSAGKLLIAAGSLLRQPANTEALLNLGDAVSETRWFSKSVERAKRQGALDLNRNASAVIPPLEDLERYPEGSLGFQFSVFMKANGLLEFRSSKAPQSEREWLRERSRVIHDLLHVILDYGIDVEDEIKLNAHLAFALRLPISCLIVGGGLLRMSLTRPARFPKLVREVFAIRQRVCGKRCLILEPIEDWLAEPLTNVRARLLR